MQTTVEALEDEIMTAANQEGRLDRLRWIRKHGAAMRLRERALVLQAKIDSHLASICSLQK